ncbi:hypothetical protein ACHHYP_15508 [Achlya hypogyna]|uniref:Microsomal glutathione S-transferase 1 n=1 Tax=Achlya hypogyna TaxID=1202772 RepID=A0A1V9YAR0_ACHHY|nr:hypothetical protein ACHHYP_15508 [Achlya hypogyna]
MSKVNDTKVLIAATAVLIVKFYIAIIIQGAKRFAAGTRPPEDQFFSKFNPRNQKQSFGVRYSNVKSEEDNTKKQINFIPSARAIEADLRWERLVRNDLENIPIGLLAAWAAVNSGGCPLVNSTAILIFTIGRIAHTFAYANSLQPHRACVWIISVFSTIVLVANSVVGIATN